MGMKIDRKNKKPYILRLSGLVLLAALLAAAALLLRGAAHTPPAAPADRAFRGVNLRPVPLWYDAAAPEETQAPEENREGESQQPQDKPEPKEQQTETQQPDGGAGGEEKKEQEGSPADKDKTDTEKPRMQLVTDLKNRTIPYGELPEGKLQFYAYLQNAEKGASVRVLLEGRRLSGSAGGRFSAALQQGKNVFTLLVYQDGTLLQTVTKTVHYQAPMADGDNAQVGEDPPTIVTNLRDDGNTVRNKNFTLQVTAYNSRGAIYHNHLRVLLDGVEITQYTGGSTVEYPLYLKPGTVGDSIRHTVEVIAWDDNGNSSYKKYTIDYLFSEEGQVIGTATLRLDLTTLGMGIVDSETYDVRQGEAASYLVARFLEDGGFTASAKGTKEVGYYLQRISGGGAFADAQIPAELKNLLTLDGWEIKRPAAYKDSLGEFDYTVGSGWMFSVNGYYPGQSLSNVYLDDGDVLSLVFTLAYGKDIGGAAAAANRGTLPFYCGTWLGGTYTPQHVFENGKCAVCGQAQEAHVHTWAETVAAAPTCEAPGEMTLTCTECGEISTRSIPALGHDYRMGPVQRESAESCTAEFTCTRCAAQRSIPCTLEVIDRREPTCGQEGYIIYRAVGTIDGTAVSGTVTDVLPKTGEHTYADGRCTLCGREEEEET